MKKKLILLCSAMFVVLCIFFYVWKNKSIRIANVIDFGTIAKVEIWKNDDCVILVEKEDIKKFTDILDSMKLKKKLQSEKDGFVLTIAIYHDNGEINNLTLLADIIIDGQWYKCDRDYCDDMLELYESLEKKTGIIEQDTEEREYSYPTDFYSYDDETAEDGTEYVMDSSAK